MLAFPFYWMLMTALRTDTDLYNIQQVPFKFNADSPTTANFRFLFEETEYAQWLVNTALVGVVVVVITLVLALARWLRPRATLGPLGTERSASASSSTYLVPPTLLFLPLSRVISELGPATTASGR